MERLTVHGLGSAGVLRRLLGLALGLATVAGCSSWNLSKSMPWPFGEEKPGIPEKIAAIWTDAVLHQPNQPTVRGFGGRLMFFEAKSDKPIKVDGTVVIYAFDETNRDPSNAKPDRKYVFTPEQLPSHYSLAQYGKSKIGHSYSVWLPWDEVGGNQKEISLLVRFEPKAEKAGKNGAGVVVGQPCRQLLPGNATTQGPQIAKVTAAGMPMRVPPVQPETQQPVQQLSYNAAAPVASQPQGLEVPPSRRMTTTTISVPGAMPSSPLASGGAAASPMPGGQAYRGEPQYSQPSATNPAAKAPATQDPTSPAQGSTAAASVFPPRSRFSPPQYRPLNEPFAPLSRDRALWPPPLAATPSAPGLPPGSESAPGSPASSPVAGSTTH